MVQYHVCSKDFCHPCAIFNLHGTCYHQQCVDEDPAFFEMMVKNRANDYFIENQQRSGRPTKSIISRLRTYTNKSYKKRKIGTREDFLKSKYGLHFCYLCNDYKLYEGQKGLSIHKNKVHNILSQ